MGAGEGRDIPGVLVGTMIIEKDRYGEMSGSNSVRHMTVVNAGSGRQTDAIEKDVSAQHAPSSVRTVPEGQGA